MAPARLAPLLRTSAVRGRAAPLLQQPLLTDFIAAQPAALVACSHRQAIGSSHWTIKRSITRPIAPASRPGPRRRPHRAASVLRTAASPRPASSSQRRRGAWLHPSVYPRGLAVVKSTCGPATLRQATRFGRPTFQLGWTAAIIGWRRTWVRARTRCTVYAPHSVRAETCHAGRPHSWHNTARRVQRIQVRTATTAATRRRYSCHAAQRDRHRAARHTGGRPRARPSACCPMGRPAPPRGPPPTHARSLDRRRGSRDPGDETPTGTPTTDPCKWPGRLALSVPVGAVLAVAVQALHFQRNATAPLNGASAALP